MMLMMVVVLCVGNFLWDLLPKSTDASLQLLIIGGLIVICLVIVVSCICLCQQN